MAEERNDASGRCPQCTSCSRAGQRLHWLPGNRSARHRGRRSTRESIPRGTSSSSPGIWANSQRLQRVHGGHGHEELKEFWKESASGSSHAPSPPSQPRDACSSLWPSGWPPGGAGAGCGTSAAPALHTPTATPGSRRADGHTRKLPHWKVSSFRTSPAGPGVKTLCFHCRAQLWSLVGELRSHKLHSGAKKKKTVSSPSDAGKARQPHVAHEVRIHPHTIHTDKLKVAYI